MGAAVALFTRLIQALNIVGQVVLAFMVITICYDSVMRYGFGAPTSWSLEVNTFLIIYIAAMTAADVQRGDGHIRITFFASRTGPGTQRAIRAVIGLVGAAFCGIMAWRGGLLTLQAAEYGERVSSSFGTPTALPYAMLPIGFGALAIQFLLEALAACRQVLKRSN
ncbi:MAG: TRAP transporter small permease [Burkholderiales bacterium]|nr:TRAP transporter small permease [Burkholderiales bacterium]